MGGILQDYLCFSNAIIRVLGDVWWFNLGAGCGTGGRICRKQCQRISNGVSFKHFILASLC